MRPRQAPASCTMGPAHGHWNAGILHKAGYLRRFFDGGVALLRLRRSGFQRRRISSQASWPWGWSVKKDTQ